MEIVKQTETKSHHVRIVDDLPQFGGCYSVEIAEKREDGFLWWKQVRQSTRHIWEAEENYNETINELS